MARKKKVGTKFTTDEYMTTAINIRKDQWLLLGDVAHSRKQSVGGSRASISEIIRNLVDENRRNLEREIK